MVNTPVTDIITGLRRGERVTIQLEDVVAGGEYIASFKVRESNGRPGTRRLIRLDGTGQTVPVPPEYITREKGKGI